jgi:integrase
MDDNNLYLKSQYNLIAKAREYHKYNNSRNVSSKTRQTYNKIAERLIFLDKCLPINCQVSKSSYYVYKAAFISFLLDKISEVVPGLDRLKKLNIEEWVRETKKLAQYLELIDAIGIDVNKSNLNKTISGSYESNWSKKTQLSNSKLKNSKANRLRTLPKNWTSRIFQAAIDSNTPFTDAIALMSITGCRPQEVGFGVSVSLCDDGDVEFLINGAKTNGGVYGQEWRRFSVHSDSAEFRYLVDRLKSSNGKMIVQANAGAICDKVTYLSKKCMPQLKIPATAYCYRHRFSGTLHNLGIDAEFISMALGHCTDASQQHYSSAHRTSDGSFLIKNIKSEKKVKMKNNSKKTWIQCWQDNDSTLR